MDASFGILPEWRLVTVALTALYKSAFTLHAEIYSARSYEEKIDRACIT